jgi:hypothetical protein
MTIRTLFLACLLSAAAAFAAQPAQAQGNCTSSTSAAIQCFVANAVATKLTQPHFGMTLAQYEAYGVAVNQIIQSPPTNLVLIGSASAIADAMPPTNADGSANAAAQQAAVNSIVSSESDGGIIATPSGVTLQEMQFYAQDITNSMNSTSGYMKLLTPGVGLRVIDSYVMTGTASGKVDWPKVNTSLATFVRGFITAGLIKVPAGVTTAQVVTFVQNVAQAIESYKVSTGRATL